MRTLLAALMLGALLLAPQQAAHAQTQPMAPPAAAGERPRIMIVRVFVTDMERSERFYRAVFGWGPAQAFGPRRAEQADALGDLDGGSDDQPAAQGDPGGRQRLFRLEQGEGQKADHHRRWIKSRKCAKNFSELLKRNTLREHARRSDVASTHRPFAHSGTTP